MYSPERQKTTIAEKVDLEKTESGLRPLPFELLAKLMRLRKEYRDDDVKSEVIEDFAHDWSKHLGSIDKR